MGIFMACAKSSTPQPTKKKERPKGSLGHGNKKKTHGGSEVTDPGSSPGQTLSSAQLKVMNQDIKKTPEMTKEKEVFITKSHQVASQPLLAEQQTQPMVSQKEKRSKSVIKDINHGKNVRPQNPKLHPTKQRHPQKQPDSKVKCKSTRLFLSTLYNS